MSIYEEVRDVYSKIVCDFSDRESCDRWRKDHEDIKVGKPTFSYMMATYNDDSLFNASVNSLLRQSFTDWELVILDNSDKNTKVWNLIENAMYADKRIRGIKSDKNLGWPKAASVCLQHIQGEYTTFLAADDCLFVDALERMKEVLERETPDILWVGNFFVEYDAKAISSLKVKVPMAKIYNEENRSDAIAEIMENIYYNSFFHYMRVDFLKEYNIDFFDPYYADCAGMTEAMVRAKKMVSVDFPVYCLTTNTSQTQGRYTWGSYSSIFVNQWKSVKSVFEKENYRNNEKISFVVIRILLNLIENIRVLCLGSCRDVYMNKIEKSGREIISQIDEIMCNEYIGEMFRIAEKTGFNLLIDTFKALNESPCIFQIDDIEKSQSAPILKLALFDGELTYSQQIDSLIQWLLDEHNPACVGFYNFIELLDKGGEMMIWKYKEDYKRISKKNMEFVIPFWD